MPSDELRNIVMINTSNLQLIPFERSQIEALLRDKRELAEILHVSIPDSWPTFPEAFSYLANLEHFPTDWHGYFFIHPKDSILVGNGGFKGKPDESGTVEIGYEIASEHWNRGFATEAVQGLLAYAFAHEDVRAVIAHTLAEINASNAVLKKVGMNFVAEVDDPEQGKIWRWQINRNEYRPS
jgi:[ribosomal protein S5]-alanine N-acetyltransferase